MVPIPFILTGTSTHLCRAYITHWTPIADAKQQLGFIRLTCNTLLHSLKRFPVILVGGVIIGHGPLTRYAKLRVVHAPGMPGTFSPPPRVSDHDMHQGTCVTHMSWCMPGSLTSGFPWSRWQVPAFPAHAQPAFLRIWQGGHYLDYYHGVLLLSQVTAIRLNFWYA